MTLRFDPWDLDDRPRRDGLPAACGAGAEVRRAGETYGSSCSPGEAMSNAPRRGAENDTFARSGAPDRHRVSAKVHRGSPPARLDLAYRDLRLICPVRLEELRVCRLSRRSTARTGHRQRYTDDNSHPWSSDWDVEGSWDSRSMLVARWCWLGLGDMLATSAFRRSAMFT